MFYTNETKLKDLTVGQLKDIIIETLNDGLTKSSFERRQYTYNSVYKINRENAPVYPDPSTVPYCGAEDKGATC